MRKAESDRNTKGMERLRSLWPGEDWLYPRWVGYGSGVAPRRYFETSSYLQRRHQNLLPSYPIRGGSSMGEPPLRQARWKMHFRGQDPRA